MWIGFRTLQWNQCDTIIQWAYVSCAWCYVATGICYAPQQAHALLVSRGQISPVPATGIVLFLLQGGGMQ